MMRRLLLLGSLAAVARAEESVSAAELAARLQDFEKELRNFEQKVVSEETSKMQEVKDRNAAMALNMQSKRRLSNRNRRLSDPGAAANAAAAGNVANFADLQGAMNHTWLIICGALVMFMQAGFALLEAGACRIKNVQNILMKNMTDVCAGTLCWYAFGWMIAYGPIENETQFSGSVEWFGHDFMDEPKVGVITPTDKPLNWFFQWAFCSAAATIVSGGIAERVNFPAYLLYTLCMTTFIYPCVVAWTWSGKGFLQGGTAQHINEVGYYDFAGSGIVHMCGGVGALTGALIVGPRTGRFDPGNEGMFDPHSLPLIVAGTFILWFGWYGFNCGSTLGLSDTLTGQLAASAAMNTTISAATGGLTILILRYITLRKFDVGGMCNGILAGLVSITAGCGNVESGSSLVIGLLGALIYQIASSVLQKAQIDDPLDAFPVHGACGIWGTLAAVVFDWGDGLGTFHGWSGFSCVMDGDKCHKTARGAAFAANAVGLLTIASWTAVWSTLILFPLKRANLLRADDSVQEAGLDAAKHSPPKAYVYEPAQGQDGAGVGAGAGATDAPAA